MIPKLYSVVGVPLMALVALLMAVASGTAQAGPRAWQIRHTPNKDVIFTVRVPANAQIWFEGGKTAQSGSLRRFASLPLDRAQDYAYHMRVVWKEGDRRVELRPTIPVHAGDRVVLDFTGSGITAQASSPSDDDPAATRFYVATDEGRTFLLQEESATSYPLTAGGAAVSSPYPPVPDYRTADDYQYDHR